MTRAEHLAAALAIEPDLEIPLDDFFDTDDIDLAEIEAAIQRGPEEVARAAKLDKKKAALVLLLIIGLRSAYESVSPDVNPLDPSVVAWIKQRAEQIAGNIILAAKENIIGTILRGLRAGWSTHEVAVAVKSQLWLLDRQSAAIQTMRQRMIESGASAKAIADAVRRAIARGLQWRAETIAITEVTAAVTAGSMAQWWAQVLAGELEADPNVRWVTAKDELVCPQCAPMDGVVYPLSRWTETPPLHPRCRCRLELA